MTVKYLGGSRRMNQLYGDGKVPITQTDDDDPFTLVTDFDWYATYSEEYQQLLISEGWAVSSTNCEYFDSEAVAILHKTVDSVSHQIVLRKDAEFYRKVFDNIPVDFYVNYLWKRNIEVDRSKIRDHFEFLYKYVRNLENK